MKLENSIKELAEMFSDMAMLVESQARETFSSPKINKFFNNQIEWSNWGDKTFEIIEGFVERALRL